MAKVSQVDQDLIRTIAELLNEANLAEIEIEQDDFRIRVTRTLPAKDLAHMTGAFAATHPHRARQQARRAARHETDRHGDVAWN